MHDTVPFAGNKM